MRKSTPVTRACNKVGHGSRSRPLDSPADREAARRAAQENWPLAGLCVLRVGESEALQKTALPSQLLQRHFGRTRIMQPLPPGRGSFSRSGLWGHPPARTQTLCLPVGFQEWPDLGTRETSARHHDPAPANRSRKAGESPYPSSHTTQCAVSLPSAMTFSTNWAASSCLVWKGVWIGVSSYHHVWCSSSNQDSGR